MIKTILPQSAVALDPPDLKTPEDVIRFSGELLSRSGKATKLYGERMVDAYHSLGPYMVLAPGIALPHARPDADCFGVGLSFIRLKDPIAFGHPTNDPVQLVFALSSPNGEEHIGLLSELSKLLLNQENLSVFENASDYEQIISQL